MFTVQIIKRVDADFVAVQIADSNGLFSLPIYFPNVSEIGVENISFGIHHNAYTWMPEGSQAQVCYEYNK